MFFRTNCTLFHRVGSLASSVRNEGPTLAKGLVLHAATIVFLGFIGLAIDLNLMYCWVVYCLRKDIINWLQGILYNLLLDFSSKMFVF